MSAVCRRTENWLWLIRCAVVHQVAFVQPRLMGGLPIGRHAAGWNHQRPQSAAATVNKVQAVEKMMINRYAISCLSDRRGAAMVAQERRRRGEPRRICCAVDARPVTATFARQTAVRRTHRRGCVIPVARSHVQCGRPPDTTLDCACLADRRPRRVQGVNGSWLIN